jgi:hypothetical protein
MTMRIPLFWDVLLCHLVDLYWHFTAHAATAFQICQATRHVNPDEINLDIFINEVDETTKYSSVNMASRWEFQSFQEIYYSCGM